LSASAGVRGWRLVRVAGPDGQARCGVIDPWAPDAIRLLGHDDWLGALEDGDLAALAEESRETVAIDDPDTLEPAAGWRLLMPLQPPECWASGVTYERSRDARVEESQAKDVYAMVYDADRPEIFMKDAACRRTVGPGQPLGVRADSTWTVPEPELVLVLGRGGGIVGVTAGNDVTARDVEGANPLYLPQAKLFAAAGSLGPAVLVPDDLEAPFAIELTVYGPDDAVVTEASTGTGSMKRGLRELVDWLLRDNPVPAGSVLYTGTGIVPPDDVALAPGMRTVVRIPGIGELRNPVHAAGDLARKLA
jgi:2-dehydro-3-deoxy-D-arabinonate dehydratase